MVDEESMDHQEKWSTFVAMNKYFRTPPHDCRSEPCLRDAKCLRSAHVLEPTNLSLSWQLACNPADSSQLIDAIDNCVDRSPPPAAKSFKYPNTSEKRKPKPKSMSRTHNPKSKVSLSPPKIMVVDAVKHWPAARGNDSPLEPAAAAAAAAAAAPPVGRKLRRDQSMHQNHELRREREERWRRELAGPSKQELPKKPPAETKRKYGVPLCHRPTMLLGPRYHAELQHYYQQQYYNQFMQQQQLQQQQQQQQQQQLQQQQQMMQQMMYYQPDQLGYSPRSTRYAVPIESMYHNIKKGKRYCGNFYYR